MPDDKEKKYCVTIRCPEVDIIVIMHMDEGHYEIATTSPRLSWVFNNGCQITIDKNFLDDFSVELVQ